MGNDIFLAKVFSTETTIINTSCLSCGDYSVEAVHVHTGHNLVKVKCFYTEFILIGTKLLKELFH